MTLPLFKALTSVADPERFDVDPDPTFHADEDPGDTDPNMFYSFTYSFQNLPPNFDCNFLSNNAGGGVKRWWVRVWRSRDEKDERLGKRGEGRDTRDKGGEVR